MSIKMIHHMLLGKNEQIMCTTCKKVFVHMANIYIETVQVSGGTSEVTETVCELCNSRKKGRK